MCTHNCIILVPIAGILRLITKTCFIYRDFYNRKINLYSKICDDASFTLRDLFKPYTIIKDLCVMIHIIIIL